MTTTKTGELKQMIEGALRMTPQNKRSKVMQAVQWRLRGPNGEYVGLSSPIDGLKPVFCPESAAIVFDGRDNEDMKLRTYEATLGELTIEIIPQVK